MKKRDKWMLGVGAVSIGFGLVIMSVGFAAGKAAYASEHTNNISYGMEEVVSGVKSIDFDIPFGDIIIERGGDQFSVSIENMKENEFKTTVENGVWKITGNKYFSGINSFNDVLDFCENSGFFFNFGDSDYYPEIHVTIPDKTQFENAEISLGAGDLWMEELLTEKAVLEVGTGSMNIQTASISKSAKVDIGTGDFSLDGTVNNLDLSCGVGNADISAAVTGKSKIECGVGEITLNLYKGKGDYYYTVDSGIGSVIINGNSYRDDSKIGNKNAGNHIDLECGIGSIYVWEDGESVAFEQSGETEQVKEDVTEVTIYDGIETK